MGRSVCAIALSLMFRLLAIQEHFDAVRSSECGQLLPWFLRRPPLAALSLLTALFFTLFSFVVGGDSSGRTTPVDRTPDEACAGSRLRGRLDLRAAS
jgi:hypothetical protein